MINIKYPIFKTKGNPTPNDHLVICTNCGTARWTIYTKNLSAYCARCENRMREGTPKEYAAAKLALERMI